MCHGGGVKRHRSGEDGEMKDTMIGVDLAKRVFQLHGASPTGQVKFRKSKREFLCTFGYV
jgi:transposase